MNNYFEYLNKAAAVALGVNGVIIKAHSSFDEVQFYFDLEKSYECVKNKIVDKLSGQKYDE